MVEGCAFTGDTLFGAGCGRVFEGTPAMMHASLAEARRAAAGDAASTSATSTRRRTSRSRRAVEPDNAAVARARRGARDAVDAVDDRRRARDESVPALGRGPVIAAAGARGAAADGASVFGAIRAWKDGFK